MLCEMNGNNCVFIFLLFTSYELHLYFIYVFIHYLRLSKLRFNIYNCNCN